MEPESFVIDDTTFVMDVRPGPERGKSTGDKFILVKTPVFVDFYRSLQAHEPRDVLEVGMFEGGSMVLFDKLFSPRRLVGVDIRPEIPALEEYRANRDHVRAFYRQSQNDPALVDILRAEFPDGIDLVVDDASHRYQLTRDTFHLVFPLLKPGGHYVIEDWSWSHQPPYQAKGNPLYDQPALSNLVIELVLNLARNRQISSIKVERGWVTVEKAENASGPIDLGDAEEFLRGRRLELI